MGSAPVADLVESLSRRQLATGLFPHVRRRAGRREVIERAPFGATFVAHALRRAMPALEPAPRAIAGAVLDRVVEALRRAPDFDGRVRFLGPGSQTRPDVDDTACVWLALGDAGERCPASVLDAIERAAVPGGGYANDFDPRAPAAVEIASTTMATCLLSGEGRRCEGAIDYVMKKVAEIEAGAAPFGFFFPSRTYAAFAVARAAVDFGVAPLAEPAERLAQWVARSATPAAPLLERAFALWVLEATDREAGLRASLWASAEASLNGEHDDDVWFTGDPRTFEASGLELVGCPSVCEAVLLDALALAQTPSRRLPRSSAAGAIGGPGAAQIERLPWVEGLTRFQVRLAGASTTVEVLAAGPGVKAYRVAGRWAVRYAGADSAEGMRACDALVAAGLDALMEGRTEARGPADVIQEPLVDVLRFLSASGTSTPELLADLAELRAAVLEPHMAEVELSFKARGDDLLEGPRFTFYQHRPHTERALQVFAALSGASGEALAGRLGPACRGLPLHLGVVHGAGRRATKLYVRTDGVGRDRMAAVLAACGPDLRLDGLEDAWVHGVGIALNDDGPRLRLYVVVPRERVTADTTADRHALEGWDLSGIAPPELEARYVHYRARPLPFERAVELVGLGAEPASRIRAGLDRAGAWRARFIGVPAKGDARSLYVTLGARMPRNDDEGP